MKFILITMEKIFMDNNYKLYQSIYANYCFMYGDVTFFTSYSRELTFSFIASINLHDDFILFLNIEHHVYHKSGVYAMLYTGVCSQSGGKEDKRHILSNFVTYFIGHNVLTEESII